MEFTVLDQLEARPQGYQTAYRLGWKQLQVHEGYRRRVSPEAPYLDILYVHWVRRVESAFLYVFTEHVQRDSRIMLLPPRRL